MNVAFNKNTSTSAALASPPPLRLVATEDVYIQFGGAAVVANASTGTLLTANTPEHFTMAATHVAAIGRNKDGLLNVVGAHRIGYRTASG